MPKLLQINTVFKTGSTGKIAEQIGLSAIEQGWESYIAFNRGKISNSSFQHKIGNTYSRYVNALGCRIFDNDGFLAFHSTMKLIKYLEKIKPNIIHLHNLHGYYLNVDLLFNYLSSSSAFVVWTFHDCWPITGHCSHFDYIGCEKWKKNCVNCPQLKEYPASFLLDNSERNYKNKEFLFNSVSNLRIITPSKWMANKIKASFLADKEISIINNGIDVGAFRPRSDNSIYDRYCIDSNKKIILGVANIWTKKKGIDFFRVLASKVPSNVQIILVGLRKSQIDKLPNNIVGILRTESTNDLSVLYSIANVFVNPTLEDNFPTTNLEAMSCGTPVVTFDTGGCAESISSQTGIVIPKGDISSLFQAIMFILARNKEEYSLACRNHVIQHFESSNKYQEYLDIYNNLIKKIQINDS